MPSDLALLSTLIGSNYPCLELIFMVPKVFEPLKFDCTYFRFGLEGGVWDLIILICNAKCVYFTPAFTPLVEMWERRARSDRIESSISTCPNKQGIRVTITSRFETKDAQKSRS